MNRLRILPVLLGCGALLALSACGGEDSDPAAWSAPSTTSASPSAAASPTTAAVSDKKLCETAKKASGDMKDALAKALLSGDEPSPELFGKILGGLEKEMSAAAAAGGSDSAVTAGLTAFGAQAGKAAAAADPATAAADPAFEKAGSTLSAACKKAGVTVTF